MKRETIVNPSIVFILFFCYEVIWFHKTIVIFGFIMQEFNFSQSKSRLQSFLCFSILYVRWAKKRREMKYVGMTYFL